MGKKATSEEGSMETAERSYSSVGGLRKRLFRSHKKEKKKAVPAVAAVSNAGSPSATANNTPAGIVNNSGTTAIPAASSSSPKGILKNKSETPPVRSTEQRSSKSTSK